MRTINVAVDGPAGAGKSTVARECAKRLGFIYVDTGALYRAVALYITGKGVSPENSAEVAGLLGEINVSLVFQNGEQRVILNDCDVSDKIRSDAVSRAASAVSAIGEVRAFLFGLQRKIAAENNVIMDGRDIGTVVLPEAQLKLFLTASPEIRAKRRLLELEGKPDCPDYETLLESIIKRDYNDSHRKIAPLKLADDGILIDTGGLGFEEVVAEVTGLIGKIQNPNG